MEDMGKTAVQLIRGSKSSRNSAQFGEKILYTPLKLSGRHRGNMEDRFLDDFSGQETAIRCKFLSEHTEELSRSAHYEDERKKRNGTEFAGSIKGEPLQPVLGINSGHVPAAISDRAGLLLEEDQADARRGQQDEGIDPSKA